MVNKKLSRILGPVLGVMVFMTSLGVGQVKALADDNVSETSVTCENTISEKEKDYSININKTVEQNGFKVTLDKVIGTKHDLKVQVKIQSDKSFDTENYNNIISEVTFGKSDYWGGGGSEDYIDDKTLLLTIEKEIDEEEFPEKGELRVDIVIPSYKINVGIDAYVDFSESFKNTLEIKSSSKIPEFDFTLNKLESNVMRTRLEYTTPWQDFEDRRDDPARCEYSSIILKAGDRMYKTEWESSHSHGDELASGTYVSEGANYDKIKNAKKISVIPLICYMTEDEIEKIYEAKDRFTEYEKINKLKEIKDNVRYLKSFDFYDGSKGEIYNIERKDNKIKVYCKGNTEEASLLMVTNMYMNYEFDIENVNYANRYEGRKNMSFYKDPNDELGYVVEFSNVPKDKTMDVNYDFNVSKIDKFEIGNEVELSK